MITGAGVSAGIDFGITLVEELRGRPMAEAGVLMAEYAPEPPITGGTLETARPEMPVCCASLQGFVDEGKALKPII